MKHSGKERSHPIFHEKLLIMFFAYLLYIDPGIGSLAVQVIIAGIVGILFFFKSVFYRTRAFANNTINYLAKLLSKGWLHPLLICIFFILFKIKIELILFDFWLVLFYLLLFSGVILILYFILLRFIGNPVKTGIIVSFFALIFLFYNPIYELLQSFALVNIFFHRIGIIILLLFLLISFFIWKTKKNLSGFNAYLNLLFLCLTLFEGGSATSNYFKFSSFDSYIEKNNFHTAKKNPAILPNIYYIISDGYTSNSSLKKYFGYENSEIKDFMKAKGFYVTQNSKSKFSATQKSISNVFNMSQGAELDSVFGNEILSTSVYIRNIQSSEAVKKLIEYNYSFINLSFFDFGEAKHFYDNLWLPSPNYLGDFLFRDTRLSSYYVKTPFPFYKYNLDIIDSLKKIAELPPKNNLFVYAHLSTTHAPFCFDRNGKIYEDERGPYPGDDKKNYLESIMYTNNQLMKIIEKIEATKIPSIIIIQGDHGSRFFQQSTNDSEQYTIFNAYFFPDGDYSQLNDSISPENSFRIVFNKYFDGHYKLFNNNSIP